MEFNEGITGLNACNGAELNFIWVELTNRCNLQCSHCYAKSGPHEPVTYGLTESDWLRILADARELGCQSVQFIGGEPTLHSSLPVLIKEASRLGYTFIEVFTNGTRISDSFLAICKTYNVQVATSLYSDKFDAHDAITRVAGSHRRTVNGLKQAAQFGIPIRVGVIEMAGNASCGEIVAQYARGLGAREVHIDQVRGVGRGEDYVHEGSPYRQLCGACGNGRRERRRWRARTCRS